MSQFDTLVPDRVPKHFHLPSWPPKRCLQYRSRTIHFYCASHSSAKDFPQFSRDTYHSLVQQTVQQSSVKTLETTPSTSFHVWTHRDLLFLGVSSLFKEAVPVGRDIPGKKWHRIAVSTI